MAYKLALLGATNEQMADALGISLATLHVWRNKHSEFLDALKNGKEVADSKVADSLYHRAIGYTHPEEKIFNNQGEIIRAETLKHYPPDTTAAIFWLKNRDPANWRDVKQVELDDKRKPARAQSIEEIDKRLEELQGKKAANG